MVRGPLFLLPRKDLLLTRLLGIDGATYPLTTWTWTNPTAGLFSLYLDRDSDNQRSFLYFF